jgi:hypothetical protein
MYLDTYVPEAIFWTERLQTIEQKHKKLAK